MMGSVKQSCDEILVSCMHELTKQHQEGCHRSDTPTQSKDRQTAKSYAKSKCEMHRTIHSHKPANTQML